MAVGCIFPFHFYEGQEARKRGTEPEIKQQEKRKEERKGKRKRALLCCHCERRSENGWEVICIHGYESVYPYHLLMLIPVADRKLAQFCFWPPSLLVL